MGLLQNIRLNANTYGDSTSSLPEVIAAAEPSPLFPASWEVWGSGNFVNRAEAMTVPAYARAITIITGTIGSLPIGRYNARDGRKLPPIPLQYQPDPSCPKAVTYAALADSIKQYGYGFVEVLEIYAEDGRPSRFRWIDPTRVTIETDSTNTIITNLLLDGSATPKSGVGELKYFPGTDEGTLTRAGRTLRTAIELEEAANRAAKEPAPSVVLLDQGLGLPKEKIDDLMAKWKQARRERSTAYINANLKMETVGFDAKAQQLVESRQFMASEIARAVGIPAWYLNAEAASMTYTNVTSERRALVDFSLRPVMTAIEQRLSMSDFISRDLEFRWDLDDFLRGNPLERVEVTAKLLELGIISIEEARAMEDLAPRGN